jgi:hypothetical protein
MSVIEHPDYCIGELCCQVARKWACIYNTLCAIVGESDGDSDGDDAWGRDD